MKTKRKFFGIAALIVLVVIGVGGVAVNRIMVQQDAVHAAFYNTGADIKSFVGDYGKAFDKAFDTGDVASLAAFYASDYPGAAQDTPGGHSLRRGRWTWSARPDTADVSAYTLVSAEPWLTSQTEALEAVTDYYQKLRSIDRIRSKIDMIEQIDQHQDVVLRVKFILDGVTREGELFQDRHFYRWHVRKAPANVDGPSWRIVSDELVEGVRVAGDGKRYVELDLAQSGIDYRHARNPKLNKEQYGDKLKFDVVEHSSSGVAVTDYNNDGWPDIFFADGKRSRLYRHNGVQTAGAHPTFTDVTAATGLDGIDQAQAGFFADIDNDGYQDLYVTRYLAPNQFYRNNGDGTYTEQAAKMGLDTVAASTSATFLDYDRDGFLDIYLGVFGNVFETVPRIPFFAQNGGPNRLFKNNKGQDFTDVTATSGVGDTGWSLAVAVGDYDNDGYPDIVVANDFGRKNLYHNNGDGTFSEVAKEAGVLDFSGGMGVVFGDFNDDGYLDLYTSNINSNQRWLGEDMTLRQYLRNVLRTKWALLDLGEFIKIFNLVGSRWTELGKDVGEGNSLFQNNGDGTFSEIKDSHANRAGWGWSVAFFDADNDSDLDIYAANGWVSQNPDSDL